LRADLYHAEGLTQNKADFARGGSLACAVQCRAFGVTRHDKKVSECAGLGLGIDGDQAAQDWLCMFDLLPGSRLTVVSTRAHPFLRGNI
jgi:hypothetical protein